MLPSNGQRKVSAIRDFPYGCGTQSIKNQRIENSNEVVANQDYCRRPFVVDRFKEVDPIMKEADFNLPANGIIGSERFPSVKRKVPPSRESKVKLLSSEESIRLSVLQSRREQLSYMSGKPLLAKGVQEKKTHKPTQNRDDIWSTQLPPTSVIQQNWIPKALTPCDKVLQTLSRFKVVFKELVQVKAVRRAKTATSRIAYDTRTILISEGMQVNATKMVGQVPGIKVGDEFQYKAELNLIGLHFDIRGGIDYINEGGMKLATSIMMLEGNGYNDIFNYDVMIYMGEGGNVMSKDHKAIQDQKLVKGNLALVNSMKKRSEVRVIHGKKRLDQRGKHYVYAGVYLVQHYWQEKRLEGNCVFKFRLCKVPGQPSIN